MSDDRCHSAKRLLARLAADKPTAAMFQTEALYHAQIEWTLDLLDVVDEVTGPATGALVADRIYEHLSGDGASEAAARQREVQAEYERLMRAPIGFPGAIRRT